jgi:hypothetical protein
MKKYIIPIAAFVLITGAANAQSAVKKTDNSVAKMSKPATKKTSASTASVTPSAPASTERKTDVAAIKRKQHKKSKSVKPVSK